MDEEEYRDVYNAVNANRCVFEKALLSRRFGCSRLVRINIAEREAAGCEDPAALARCTAFLDSLRHKAAFALGQTQVSGALPHGREIKVQCGGLLGLQSLIDDTETPAFTQDIHGLIQQAMDAFGDLDRIAYDRIMPHIAHYQGRRKRRR